MHETKIAVLSELEQLMIDDLDAGVGRRLVAPSEASALLL